MRKPPLPKTNTPTAKKEIKQLNNKTNSRSLSSLDQHNKNKILQKITKNAKEEQEPIRKLLTPLPLPTNKMTISNKSLLIHQKKPYEQTQLANIIPQNIQKNTPPIKPKPLLPAIRVPSKSLHIKGNIK